MFSVPPHWGDNRIVPYAQVPPTGSERWVRSLGLPSSEGWRPWAAGGVTAGGITEYQDPAAEKGGGLAFATVCLCAI